MREPYSYLILRYVHDVVIGEFANVGVVLLASDSGFLRGRFVSTFRRLGAMFGEIDEGHLSDILQHLDRAFAEFHLPENGVKHDLRHVAQQILPADDSSLQWSPAGGGITGDPAGTLNHLFQRFVQQHYEAVAAAR